MIITYKCQEGVHKKQKEWVSTGGGSVTRSDSKRLGEKKPRGRL